MTNELETLMKETEINNTFDLSAVSDTLKMVTENSFNYLYRLQRNMIRFKEFYFPNSKTSTTSEVYFGDMYLDEKLRVCIQIDVDLVKQTARDAFYNSDIYKKEFTLEDIENNPDLFERTVLISVDRKYLFDIKIKMVNGITIIILPYQMSFLYTKENNIIEHQTSVILVDNECFRRISTHRGLISAMAGNEDGIIIDSTSASVTKFRTDGTYMAFAEFPNGVFSLMSSSTILPNGKLKIDFPPRIQSLIENTSGNFLITLVFMKDMYEYRMKNTDAIMGLSNNKTGQITTPIMMIDREDGIPFYMPIPTENMLVLKRISDGGSYNGEYETGYQLTTEIHYPNMYIVSDPNMDEGNIYRVFYFYKKGYDLHYTNRFQYFYNYLKRKLNTRSIEDAVNLAYFDKITNLTVDDRDVLTGIFRKLFNYELSDYKYNVIDYSKNHMSQKTPYEYRVEKLKRYVEDDTNVLKKYVRRQNKVSSVYRLFVELIDLTKRIRYNTSSELSFTIEFDEPRYVFLFQNPCNLNPLDMRIWVDGKLCMNLIHENEDDVDYIYIPVTEIRDDSYIEITIYGSAEFTGEVYFPDTDTYNILHFANSRTAIPTINDIIFEDRDDPSIQYALEDFEVFRMVNKYDLSTLDADEKLKANYCTFDDIKIRAKSERVLHRFINIKIRKKPYYTQINFDRTGYPIVSLDEYYFNKKPEYYRIYKNGLLMPKSMYILKDNFDNLRLQMLFPVNPGDQFALEISPYRNDLLYFTEEIPENGIIDLTDIIDKPFDILEYDVFLNGRKLNETNVFPVTDTKIWLRNIDSIYHLEIYEKDRDEEYFGWTKNAISYFFRPEDLFKEDFVTEEDKVSIMEDIISIYMKEEGIDKYIRFHENTNNEDKNCDDTLVMNDELRIKIFYYEELLPKRLVNPMLSQFNNEYLKSEYPEIATTYLIEDSEMGIEPLFMTNDFLGTMYRPSSNILYIDPDISAETATEIYMMGDYDEICEQLMKKDGKES